MDSEYTAAVLTEYKLLRNKYESLTDSLSLWKNRVTLASEKGETALLKAAEEKVRALQEECASLEAAKNDLERELERAKQELKANIGIKVTGSDPRTLLAQLQKIAGAGNGAEDDLDKKLDTLSVESELERLKRDLSEK